MLPRAIAIGNVALRRIGITQSRSSRWRTQMTVTRRRHDVVARILIIAATRVFNQTRSVQTCDPNRFTDFQIFFSPKHLHTLDIDGYTDEQLRAR